MWKESVTIGERTLTLETGRIAKQANGAVLLREGNTVLLSTVVFRAGDGAGLDFFPLTVDYREYLSAAGRIPGSFLRREGRQSDHEVMSSRLCDRSIRPLFPKTFRAETQVQSTVMSFDPQSDPAVLSIASAAGAIGISELPFKGPVAAVRVTRSKERLIALPTPAEREAGDLDLVLSLNRDGIVMIEGGARQVSEADLIEAIEFGREQAAPLLDLLEQMSAAAGKPKLEPESEPEPDSRADGLRERAREPLTQALATPEKQARHAALKACKAEAIAQLQAGHPDEPVGDWASAVLDDLEQRLMREAIAQDGRRVDGRGAEEIRAIECEVDWLPSTHGSALFTRGETQAMVSLTLGTNQDRMLLEGLDGVKFDRFLLHYSFPPYSVGEARPMRGPGRREVGHGHLARRALLPVLPPEEQFPYTLRIVSEISESNGSSSMATVCGATLALMDGGVPIAAPVAGIAMGLIREGEEIVILSDILGDEDHLGDMDFKVAGTAEGITAIQMDNKLGSLPEGILGQALEQARQGRRHILGEMAKVLAETRPELKPHVPIQVTVNIAPSRVRELIGPGGKVIQKIQADTETRLEVNDEGLVRIYAPNRSALDAARGAVLDVAGSLDVGATYDGVVTGVKDFGAFVRIRSHEGLVHISEWASQRTENMQEAAKVGDTVRVTVLEPDRQGRLSLSRKAAM
ncbi:MAG: polyribonucleotide nucleotidyltransferase [SAR324 cluster bacterium]|nr:polyribonucleotide nucleotidyltransferase [SAR324 cluster bacterium]